MTWAPRWAPAVAQDGALPALPVGPDRDAARVAVRGHARPVRGRPGRGGLGARGEPRRADHRAADGWTADRLGTLERNILRIGVYELEEGTVPYEVAINEAVVLAKRYATDEASRLVNGILGRIAGER